MTGINTLRHRPGLALEGKLVHSEDPSRLIHAAGPTAAGEGALHKIKTFHRIQ